MAVALGGSAADPAMAVGPLGSEENVWSFVRATTGSIGEGAPGVVAMSSYRV